MSAVREDELARLLDEPVDWRYKAFPPTPEPVPLRSVGEQGWNVLVGDLPFPVLLLKESALRHNIALLADYCRERDILLAPHGKTTMAPQLFRRQLDAGAWGMTAATIAQVRVFRAFGVPRVLLANELVEPTALRWLAAELAADPEFDFFCLVDSSEAVAAMSAALAATGLERPVQVLVEVGFDGGRAGCRTPAEAAEVAAAAAASPALELAGVEGYEGVIGADREPATLAAVERFLGLVREVATELARAGLFAGRERLVVTAGGSAYFDRAVELLTPDWGLDQQVDVVLRCGSYVTHDSAMYERVSPLAGVLRPAIEAWGAVLSRPEPELAIVGFGKRDVPHDVELPLPEVVQGRSGRRRVDGALTVTALNDQHAFVRLPAEDELAVGDLLGCGVCHPCTSFDKWRLIPVVDDDYTVVDAVRTFF